MANKKDRHYVDNDELRYEIMQFKKTGVMSEALGEMILKIANRYTNIGKFRSYTWKDDFTGEAVLTCVKYCRSFNPKISPNAFGYITQICYRAYQQYLKKQKKHSNIKKDCIEGRERVSCEGDDGDVIGIDYQNIKKRDPVRD